MGLIYLYLPGTGETAEPFRKIKYIILYTEFLL
jgi:hypothetical protein